MNDFRSDLNFSHSPEVEEFWQTIYKSMFLDFHHTEVVTDKSWQFKGVDRIVYLSNGHFVHIEEKIRRRYYGDILLEYIANDRTKSVGWIEKPLNVDYLVYGILDNKKSIKCAYAFPFAILQKAWRINKVRWLGKYGTKSAKNRGYNTLSCPIPTKELLSVIANNLVIDLREQGKQTVMI